MRRFQKLKRILTALVLILALAAALLFWREELLSVLGFSSAAAPAETTELVILPAGEIPTADITLPTYEGAPYTIVNSGIPAFGRESLGFSGCYACYSELDRLGRAGAAMACVGLESMPAAERGPIGDIRPSGWHNIRYDDRIEDRYLFNRCHILGYQLSGDNGDIHNLFTGTRYLNVEGMLPFENEIASYLRETGKHVLYRATPRYEGNELVARGIELEAWSIEDQGRGVCFHVFVHNVQPGVIIDYETGESRADPDYKK